jgi:hypothetical protein
VLQYGGGGWTWTNNAFRAEDLQSPGVTNFPTPPKLLLSLVSVKPCCFYGGRLLGGIRPKQRTDYVAGQSVFFSLLSPLLKNALHPPAVIIAHQAPCHLSVKQHTITHASPAPRRGPLSHCQRQFGWTGTTRGCYTTSHPPGRSIRCYTERSGSTGRIWTDGFQDLQSRALGHSATVL